jgi:hypothetical protein
MFYKKHGMLQVKADVETQGVESLANEVWAANFVNIDDVVGFVNWLDEELSFLVSSPKMPFIQHLCYKEPVIVLMTHVLMLKRINNILGWWASSAKAFWLAREQNRCNKRSSF